MDKRRYICIIFIVVLMAGIIIGKHVLFNQNKFEGAKEYFFQEDKMEYQCHINTLEGNEIVQNLFLHVRNIKQSEEGSLYCLELDQVEVENPYDEIRMGRRFLGYFWINDQYIYLIPLKNMTGYTEEDDKNTIAIIEKGENEILENGYIVFANKSTEKVPDKEGWFHYIQKRGRQIEYKMYNEYQSGTKEYLEITWEKDKGITYYRHGSGSGLMEIEMSMISQ